MRFKIGLNLTALALSMLASSVRAERESRGFRFQRVSKESLGIWEGANPVLVYNHGVIRKSSDTPHSAYIHPLYGLDGEILTDDFPKDHVYHRGLYWAWPHVTVGEKDVDLWSLKGIRIEFKRWLKQEASEDSATLIAENYWIVDESPVVREVITLTAHKTNDNGRFMDTAIEWTPIGKSLTLRGAEGKSYGGLTLRFAPRSRTVITTPNGRAPEDMLNKRLAWVDLSGDFRGSDKMSGISMIPARGPDTPHTWMTRHYGLLAVGWPGVSARTFPTNRAFTHRATLYIHRDNPSAEDLQSTFDKTQSRERRKRGADSPTKP